MTSFTSKLRSKNMKSEEATKHFLIIVIFYTGLGRYSVGYAAICQGCVLIVECFRTENVRLLAYSGYLESDKSALNFEGVQMTFGKKFRDVFERTIFFGLHGEYPKHTIPFVECFCRFQLV